MEVKDITRVCFTSRRTAQKQGDLPVRYGLFGQVVLDDERIAASIPEKFTDSCSCKGGVEL